jgi:hypothetical protein
MHRVEMIVPGLEGYVIITFTNEFDAGIFWEYVTGHKIKARLVTITETVQSGGDDESQE